MSWTAHMQDPASSIYNSIYALVRQVPPGRVTSYGRIARQVGCTARSVGFAMAALPTGRDVPWQRVINTRGKSVHAVTVTTISIQRLLLEAEGVQFDARGRVDLHCYGWEVGQG